MSAEGHNTVARVSAAEAELAHLLRPFVPPGFVTDCEVVRSHEIPEPARSLLVHQKHMTIELEQHHGKPVDVRVLQERLDHDSYTRTIGLNLRGTPTIVEWGICKLHLRYLSEKVRDEVLAKAKPLGVILIENNVYRRIEPRHYVKFAADSPVVEFFGGENDVPVYGRLGVIYCDDAPAIELLEIAVNTEVKDS